MPIFWAFKAFPIYLQLLIHFEERLSMAPDVCLEVEYFAYPRILAIYATLAYRQSDEN